MENESKFLDVPEINKYEHYPPPTAPISHINHNARYTGRRLHPLTSDRRIHPCATPTPAINPANTYVLPAIAVVNNNKPVKEVDEKSSRGCFYCICCNVLLSSMAIAISVIVTILLRGGIVQCPETNYNVSVADVCQTQPCINGGLCYSRLNSNYYICACLSGYKGMQCQTKIPLMSSIGTTSQTTIKQSSFSNEIEMSTAEVPDEASPTAPTSIMSNPGVPETASLSNEIDSSTSEVPDEETRFTSSPTIPDTTNQPSTALLEFKTSNGIFTDFTDKSKRELTTEQQISTILKDKTSDSMITDVEFKSTEELSSSTLMNADTDGFTKVWPTTTEEIQQPVVNDTAYECDVECAGDIVLILDRSYSMSGFLDSNKELFNAIALNLTIGDCRVLVSLIFVYDSQNNIMWGFDSKYTNSSESLLHAFDTFPTDEAVSGFIRLAESLDLARTAVLPTGRPTAADIVIMFWDGDNNLTTAAMDLHALNVSVLSVAPYSLVGWREENVKSIVTSLDDLFYVETEGFVQRFVDRLEEILDC